MKNKKLFFVSVFFMSIFFMSFVQSWGPATHTYLSNQIEVNGQENDIIRMCFDNGINEEAFRGGSMLPDITVTKYYSEGGREYKLTHNWLFQQELLSEARTEDEKCLAYGVMAHLLQDSVSHTDAVPQKIESLNIKNWLLHPLLEKKYDSEISKQHPEVAEQVPHILDAYYGQKGDRYVQMIENALGENIDFNVRTEINNLGLAFGSFYELGMAPTEDVNTLFASYKYINKITDWLHPYVAKSSVADIEQYITKIGDLTINTFNNLGARYSMSPHGFSELQKADQEAGNFVTYILILIILIFTGFPMYLVWKKKKFRYAFLILLIIPAIILAITIVYMIL